MQTFGKVRNISNRLDDFGYAMASGDLLGEIQSVADNIAALEKRIEDNKYQKALAWKGWEECKNTYTFKGAIDTCRKNKEAEVAMYQTRIDSDTAILSARKEKLNSLKSQLEADQQMQDTLAQQGLTTEAVLQQATIQATQKAQADEEMAKTTKYIIISVAAVLILAGGFYLYRKIKAKKLK
jgi:cobalamin biosynthesis Mg chelatase CobN